MEVVNATLDLSVFHQETLIGRLSFDPAKSDFSFRYDNDWVNKKRFVLSPHIPLNTAPAPDVVLRFLENLLPEGDGLVHLAQLLNVKRGNLYALIAAIGAETTGALTMVAGLERPRSSFRVIERVELEERIKERRQRPIGTWDGKPRLSVAGVQEKLPVVIKDGQFGLGEGDIASTHILKFGNDSSRYLVLNEYFCMRLAHAVGIEAADCELLDFGERVLAVKRFDRKWQGKSRVQRFHIIDGCQALDLRPIHKYERFLGDQPHVRDFVSKANLQNVYAFCGKNQVPAKDQLKLLQWVFFNLLIGNSDHHVKNISFFVEPEGLRLTPFYDLVSVTMYEGFEHALAFHIGDTFDPNEVNAYQLAEMASELNLKKPFIATQLKKVCQSTLKQIEKIEIDGLSPDETAFVADLRERIKKRSQKFLLEAPEIAKFKSL